MDKLQINRDFKARTQNLGRIVCTVLVLAMFALAAAVYAASSVQADAPFPGDGAFPTTPAIYPEFTIAPRPPGLQLAAEHFYERHIHNSPTWFRGIASWYGPSFDGRLTANGEVYDMYAMTAATTESHPRLPLGTQVQVVDTQNGRSVVVRITDRGPLPGGRIIDLSYGAARKLAMVRPGIAHVRIHVLRWGRNVYHAPSRG
ncbi:MAG: septal ring lytic transglycosylase RlpA family protein [Terracidiphilus sp.]